MSTFSRLSGILFLGISLLAGPVSATQAAFDLESRRIIVGTAQTSSVRQMLLKLALSGAALQEAQRQGLDVQAPLPTEFNEKPPQGKLKNIAPTLKDLIEETLKSQEAVPALCRALGLSESVLFAARNNWLKDVGLSLPVTGNLHEAGIVLEALLDRYPDASSWEIFRPIVTIDGVTDRSQAQRRLYSLERAVRWSLTSKLLDQNRFGTLLLFTNPRSDGSLRRLVGWGAAATEQEAARRAIGAVADTYRKFETLRIYEKGDKAGSVRIFKGSQPKVDLLVREPLVVTLLRSDIPSADETEVFHAAIHRPTPISAPLKAGTPLGEVRVYLRDTEIGRAPLEAASDISKGGVLTRIADELRMAFERSEAR